MNNKHITWKHLQKFLTCQEYYVWNDFSLKVDLEDNDTDNFWSLDFDENDKEEANYIEVHKNGFNIVQKRFNEWIKEEYKTKNIFIIKEKSLELKIAKTKEAMSDDNIDVVLFPVFEYKNGVSKPTLFDKENKKMSNLNINTSTKRVDYIRAYFDYEIITKNKHKIENISIYTIEIKDFEENDEITFDETFYANTGMTKPKPKSRTIPSLKESALSSEEKEGNTIFEKIRNKRILNLKSNSKKEQIYFVNIDTYLDGIEGAKNAKRVLLNHEDITLWGTNKYFNEIALEDFKYLLPLSGTLLKKKKILEFAGDKQLLEDFYQEHKVMKNIINKVDEINYEELEKIINLLDDKNVVWYDFEGFSLPFPIIPYTLPYQQLIFQVSVIKTEKNKITNVNNFIVDPKYIEYNNFFEIIDSIYSKDVEAYVVYNKTYENSKLNAMSEIFYKYELKQHSTYFSEKVKEYNKKIKIIIDRTVDLLDLFKTTSLSGPLPPIFLWELYGFSSIKKIEKYITKKDIDLEVMIKPYSQLVVQNGLMAMSKAIDRNQGGIGDEEWNETSEELKKYCENDVRAMLMVYHFAKKLLKDKEIT